MLVPGLARHPELLTGVVRAAGARRAVVVMPDFERPPLSELRTWGEAGGLSPLGVHAVALDILRAQRTPGERTAYAVRMVRAAESALDAGGMPHAARRPVGVALSRRGLLSGHATTWVPVVAADPLTCLGTSRCERCVQACPEDALRIEDGELGGPPLVNASGCTACSACLDVCPSGALSLDGHDPGTLACRLGATLQVDDGQAAPALVFACQSAVEPLHHLGERGGLPGWLALELTCLGGVGSAWYLAALAAGAPTVQVLPCARCRGGASLAEAVLFTRRLLEAMGDTNAARRVGVLPESGSRLRRAVRAAEGLIPMGSGQPGRIPHDSATATSAQVAAWAVGTLESALTAGVEHDTGSRPRVVLGPGAPLGSVRAAEGCTACGVCARTCPTGALTLASGSAVTELVLDPSACTGCGVCVQTCPENVLDVIPGVHLDLLAGGSLPIAAVPVTTCVDCGQGMPSLPAAARSRSLPAALVNRCPPCRQIALAST